MVLVLVVSVCEWDGLWSTEHGCGDVGGVDNAICSRLEQLDGDANGDEGGVEVNGSDTEFILINENLYLVLTAEVIFKSSFLPNSVYNQIRISPLHPQDHSTHPKSCNRTEKERKIITKNAEIAHSE